MYSVQSVSDFLSNRHPDCEVRSDDFSFCLRFVRTVNWADHGRDILNFVISYIDANPSSGDSSRIAGLEPADDVDSTLLKLDNLPTISPGAASPLQRKYRDRLIVGIGHSLGGGGTAFAATACPSLFSSVIFLDPVLVAPHHPRRTTRPLAGGALVRKQKWKSREDALAGFRKKAFFNAWDDEVLRGYCEFGMRDLPDGSVALKTTARNEAVSPSLPMDNFSSLTIRLVPFFLLIAISAHLCRRLRCRVSPCKRSIVDSAEIAPGTLDLGRRGTIRDPRLERRHDLPRAGSALDVDQDERDGSPRRARETARDGGSHRRFPEEDLSDKLVETVERSSLNMSYFPRSLQSVVTREDRHMQRMAQRRKRAKESELT